MAQERQNNNIPECMNIGNLDYCRNYLNWILPHVYGRVCDIGAGIGYLSFEYAKKDNVMSVWATDKFISDEILCHHKMTRFVSSTEDFIKQDYSKFDCILCTEHIEHLNEPAQVALLEWVKKNLKDDGLFMGSMPDVEHSGNPFHIKEYTREQWKVILDKYFKHAEVVQLADGPSGLYVWKAKI